MVTTVEELLKIQNIMEPYVAKRVNDMYDELFAEKNSFLSCDCENCRLDTICYVLNRIPAKYVVSGRGVTHAILSSDSQMKADTDALIIDGIRIVNTAKRPYHTVRTSANDNLNCPAFIFPVFVGNVFV